MNDVIAVVPSGARLGDDRESRTKTCLSDDPLKEWTQTRLRTIGDDRVSALTSPLPTDIVREKVETPHNRGSMVIEDRYARCGRIM